MRTSWTHIALDEIDSTNSEAARLAEAGARHLTVVTARRQSGGRGRQGRRWISAEGNLHWSAVLRPAELDVPVACLSLAAPLAVADALSAFLADHDRPLVKWPNDVLVRERKIAGVLMEVGPRRGGDQAEWIVLGIGIDVASAPVEGVRWPAVSLADLTAGSLTAAEVADALEEALLARLDPSRLGGKDRLIADYRGRLYGIGRAVEVCLSDERPAAFAGTFAGVSLEGYLELAAADGSHRTIAAGDVRYL